jgi:hypothetical protein
LGAFKLLQPRRLAYCLLASKHIGHIRPSNWEPSNPKRAVDETLDYYEQRFVGLRSVDSGGANICVRFNSEEIHLFTNKKASPGATMVERKGSSGEIRYFDIARARMLDEIIGVISKPAKALPAKDPGAALLVGPHSPEANRRIAVVVSQSRFGEWYVRTAYPMSPNEFAAALRSNRGRASRWPPE